MEDESVVITGIQHRVIWLDGTRTQQYEIAPSIGPTGIRHDPITVRWARDENDGPPFATSRENTIVSFRCQPEKVDGHWLMLGTELEPTPQTHADDLTAHLNFASAPEHQSDRLVISRVAEVPWRPGSALLLRLVEESMDSTWSARSSLRFPRRTVFRLPDVGGICPQRRLVSVATSRGKLAVLGDSELQDQFVEELLEPVATSMGFRVEWAIDERIVPDVQRHLPFDLGAAGYAWPQYRIAKAGEVPDIFFDDHFLTGAQPVPWMGGRLMRFELWAYELDVLDLGNICDSVAGFLNAGSVLLDELTQRVFDDCVECMQQAYYGDPMPFVPPVEPSDVWDMEELRLNDTLQISIGKDGAALIGLDFTPPWEDEHGLDLFLEGPTARGKGRSGDMYNEFG